MRKGSGGPHFHSNPLTHHHLGSCSDFLILPHHLQHCQDYYHYYHYPTSMHIHFFLKFDMRRKLSDSNVVPDGSQRRMGGLFANWGTSSFQPGDPALIGNMLTHGSVKMMSMMMLRIKGKLWRWSTNDLRLPYASLLLMIFLHKVHLLPSPSSTKGGRMMSNNNVLLVEMMINCPSLRIG